MWASRHHALTRAETSNVALRRKFLVAYDSCGSERLGASTGSRRQQLDFLVPESGPEQTAISRYVNFGLGKDREDWRVCNPDRCPVVRLHSRILHRDRDRGCKSTAWLKLTALARIGRVGE